MFVWITCIILRTVPDGVWPAGLHCMPWEPVLLPVVQPVNQLLPYDPCCAPLPRNRLLVSSGRSFWESWDLDNNVNRNRMWWFAKNRKPCKTTHQILGLRNFNVFMIMICPYWVWCQPHGSKELALVLDGWALRRYCLEHIHDSVVCSRGKFIITKTKWSQFIHLICCRSAIFI